MSDVSQDHSLLLSMAAGLARLESKVDAIDQRLSSIDRRLEDHETRLRTVEVDYVSEGTIAKRDEASAVARRWLVGLLIASTVTILMGVASIILN